MAELKAGWYAIQVRSRCEKSVVAALERKAYEVLLPVRKRTTRWAHRLNVVEEPLFPGYAFCSLRSDAGAKILTTPGVLRIVGIGRVAERIADVEIESLKKIMESGIDPEPWPYLRRGQAVVVHGPLRGAEGIVVSCDDSAHMVVSVTLLLRLIAVRVERDWVTAINNPSQARILDPPDVRGDSFKASA
jgi:transcription antitermination factor NusG